MQWTSKICLSEERISNPRHSLWQSGLFRYQVHECTKTLQNFSNVRHSINLCPRRNLQRHKTKTWKRKHVPISVSISSNIVEESILLCNSDPHHLFASFIGALENLASQSKAKTKNLFLDIETTIKIELGSILEKLTQRHNRRQNARFHMSQDDCHYENCAWTQFLKIQKKPINWSSWNSGTLLQCFTCV